MTVIGYVPAATDEPAATVIVELPPAVTEVGLKLTVIPAGAPDEDRLTGCADPDVTAVVSVAVVEPPTVTEPEVGFVPIEKSLVEGEPLTVTSSYNVNVASPGLFSSWLT